MVGAMANIPMRSGMVIVNPIPKEYEADEDMIDRATAKALREAEKNGITGRDVTPFLLARIAELTEGASLNANIRLVSRETFPRGTGMKTIPVIEVLAGES